MNRTNRAPVRALFRRQAVNHAYGGSYGTVLLATPTSHAVLTVVFVLTVLSLLLFLSTFNYSRKAHLKGILLPSNGLISIAAAQPGSVADIRVAEGQSVRAGDVLFVLTNERVTAGGSTVELSIGSLLESRRKSVIDERGERRAQASQLRASLERRAAELAKEAARLDEQVSLLERRVELATAVHVKYKEMQQSENFFSAFKVQEKESELLDQLTRLADARRARIVAEREQEGARSDLRNVDAQLKLRDSQSERAIAVVEQELTENQARREILVRAPQDGVVSAITAQRGQFAEAGNTLAKFLSSGGELEAELFASSHSAGLLKVGLPVALRFESFPLERFGQGQGVVREISRASLASQEVSRFGPGAQSAASAGPVYRVRVKLQSQRVFAYGVAHLLPPGGAIDASIVLESRPLYQWMLDPLYTVTGRS